MIERHPPDDVLNSALHTPVESIHHNRRPHTIARESWRATGSEFRGANPADTRLTKRSRRLDVMFSSYVDADAESQIQDAEQLSLPEADISPTQRAADDGDSGNASSTTQTALPSLWQTPVYETVLEVPPPKQFLMNRVRKPQYWQFIVLVAHYQFWDIGDDKLKNEHAAYAYCTRCKRAIQFKKKNSGVERQMSKSHQAELDNYGKEDDTIRVQYERNLDAGSSELRPPLREISAEQQKEMYVLLARWIAAHFRPLLLIEDKGFIAFIKFITETICGINMHLPGRTRLRADIVILAGDLRIQVKSVISRSCTYYSITSDIWTTRNARSYIAFTVHYVNDEFEFVSWTLEVNDIPGKHDAAVIAAALELIMEEWGLSKALCCRFARDSGSNMVAAGNIMGTDYAACIAHELHLIVSGLISKKKTKYQHVPAWEAMVSAEAGVSINENEEDDELSEDDRVQMGALRGVVVDEMEEFLTKTLARLGVDGMATMREIVQSFRTLAVYFRKSPKARTCLENIQKKELGVAPEKVVPSKSIAQPGGTAVGICWYAVSNFIGRVFRAFALFSCSD
ncbi:hypothetical protein PR001_g10457 [Phytophthora rubi]|uniref:BED-type domain-containing protein n=1 Tax=Phytophthora rubi TaxID=129364 RepID=A0A6A3MTQ6_9STRA|nr:hypothetical protein PR001_g10457 [Phytophthora rubi]